MALFFVDAMTQYVLRISLGDIRYAPTRWVFGIFPGFCEFLVQCAKISSLWGGGGGYVYTF